MSYNGSGTFVINSTGQPVVTNTTISSTVFNALTADLATGLSTAICKDGQTTTTARVPFASGISTAAATPAILTNGKAVSIALTSQTVGATTLTIPDFASVVDEFTFKTKAQTMSNKTFVAPVLGAATATSISFSSTSGVIGTTTNDSAAAGSVGEYVSSTVAPGSAVAVAVSTQANDITTISLTAGDWDVSLNGQITSAGSSTTRVFFWIGTTAGNSTAEFSSSSGVDYNFALAAGATYPGSVPSFRVSISSTTTYRFKAQATFAGTNPTIAGRISARRVR